MKKTWMGATFALSVSLSHQVAADPATVEAVDVKQSVNTWTFSVTLSHGDTGWDDYADGWRVILEDGTILGMRELLHPHVEEQPFTRNLSGLKIPDNVHTVFIEARTNVDGWGDQRFNVDLKQK
ncbi:MAG: hypothetical protein RIE24_25485 [Silicimonas sp.]